MVKHQVRPGITGWAQVNGWRGDTSIEKRIECDIYYIENWGCRMDIKILFLTVFLRDLLIRMPISYLDREDVMKRVNKKSLFILIGTFIITIALFGLFNRYYEDEPKNIKVIFNVNSEKVVEYKVIYDTEGSLKWSDNNSVKILYSSIGKVEVRV